MVACGEPVFHDGVEVWEDAMSTAQPVTEARKARRELAAGNVVDASGGHELAGDREDTVGLLADALGPGERTTLIEVIMEGEARHE